MRLTCRVPCATCPPGLLCLCNQQSTPVPLDGTLSTTGNSSDAEDGTRWGKKDTACVDLNAQAVPEVLPAPTLLQL